jgi:chaperonin GroES
MPGTLENNVTREAPRRCTGRRRANSGPFGPQIPSSICPSGKENYMATKLTPLHDRILVRRVEEAETTRGGIIIPDTAKDKPQEGEVVAVGKGKVNEEGKVRPLDVKEGDRILFGKYSGTEIKIDGEEFLIMREEEVLGTLSGARKAASK